MLRLAKYTAGKFKHSKPAANKPKTKPVRNYVSIKKFIHKKTEDVSSTSNTAKDTEQNASGAKRDLRTKPAYAKPEYDEEGNYFDEIPEYDEMAREQLDQFEYDSYLDTVVDEQLLPRSEVVKKSRTKFLTALDKLRQAQHEKELENEQRKLELLALESATERYYKSVEGASGRRQAASLPPAQDLLKEWWKPLVEAVREAQRAVLSAGDITKLDPDLKEICQYITILDADKTSVITYNILLGRSFMKRNPTFTDISFDIGNSIQAELNNQKLKKTYFHRYIKKDSRQILKINSISEMYLGIDPWPRYILVKLGAYLINLFIKIAKIPTLVDGRMKHMPAFEHVTETVSANKMTGFIKPTEALSQVLNKAHSHREEFDAKMLPMLVKPNQWTFFNKGAYLTVDSMIVRPKEGSHLQTYILRDAILNDVFDGLNVLNATQWVVNKPVFDVMRKVWEDGGGLGELPPRVDDQVPEKPDTEDPDVIRKWKKKVQKIKQHNRDLHSLRCDTTYKIQVAEQFYNRSFYFPHNVDFRGRAYPIPPHLNHLGADINRGLLLFAEGQPITEKGIFWLKIHLANLDGKDKLSFEERVQYIDENIDDIMDSADKPLDGKRWFLGTENPWQALAACIELTNCLRSPVPAEYVSRLPVQMDGSCNGLQHYAALGRDNLGALHVNLLPTEKPMDVYNGVLALVVKYIENDARNGNELAKALVGKVYRSTIKQTVMTSVYGVTYVGAREQIQRRLKEKKEIEDELVYKASCYLASVTLKSLGEVFKGAKAIMDWLNECAYLISSAGEPVFWITPLGLPVVQPYRSAQRMNIKTVLQNVTLVDRSDELPVSRQKQKSAFPPNYVHSMDASHMLMTAKACKDDGITFASVHDSFWCHAHNVDKMNDHIRRQFIELHSQPLLETLLNTFKRLHPDVRFPPVPPKGCLDLNRIMHAKYFFD